MYSKQNKLFLVYKHTSPDGKVYIGITCRATERRWRNGEGYKRHPYFYNAITKYGWENFKHEILLTNLSEDEAKQREKELIKKYNSNEKDFGYNLTEGGEGGALTGEALEKMRTSKIGQKQSEATIEKRKKTFKYIKLNLGPKNGMYGKDPWNKGKKNIYLKEQLEHIREASRIATLASPKFQAYQERRKKIREQYNETPKICEICGKALSWERRNLKTCDSDYCKKIIHSKKRIKNDNAKI